MFNRFFFEINKLYRFFLAFMVISLDLISKFLTIKNLPFKETISLLPSLNLYYTRNYGMIFSLFDKNIINNTWQYWIFIIITIIICLIVLILMISSIEYQNIDSISYSLIFGGGVSNLIDRLWHGFVIDMIDFYIGSWHFATFNLADSAICLGITLYLINNMFFKQK